MVYKSIGPRIYIGEYLCGAVVELTNEGFKVPWHLIVDMPQSQMAHALDGAKLVGHNGFNQMCVWYGGYGFNVYDTSSWEEVDYFSGGGILTKGQASDAVMKDAAIKQMKKEGFEVIA